MKTARKQGKARESQIHGPAEQNAPQIAETQLPEPRELFPNVSARLEDEHRRNPLDEYIPAMCRAYVRNPFRTNKTRWIRFQRHLQFYDKLSIENQTGIQSEWIQDKFDWMLRQIYKLYGIPPLREHSKPWHQRLFDAIDWIDQLLECAESNAKYVQHQFYSTILWEMIEHTSRWNKGQLSDNMRLHKRMHGPPPPSPQLPENIDQDEVSDSDSDDSFSFEHTIRERENYLLRPYESSDSEQEPTMSSGVPLPQPHPGASVRDDDPYFARGMQNGVYTAHAHMVERTGEDSKVKSVTMTSANQTTFDLDPLTGEVIGVTRSHGGSTANASRSSQVVTLDPTLSTAAAHGTATTAASTQASRARCHSPLQTGTDLLSQAYTPWTQDTLMDVNSKTKSKLCTLKKAVPSIAKPTMKMFLPDRVPSGPQYTTVNAVTGTFQAGRPANFLDKILFANDKMNNTNRVAGDPSGDPYFSDSDDLSDDSSDDDSEDDTAGSNTTDNTSNRRNKKKSGKIVKRKKKSRKAYKILGQMQKHFKESSFLKLQWDEADPRTCLRNYDQFIRQLHGIFMHHSELEYCLMQPGQIYEAKTKHAEHAFFSLVKNNCDLTYMIKIDNYIQAKYRRTGNKGLYKGSEILAYLRELILSNDPALKRQARQAIERLQINSSESISRFNNQFSKAVRDFEIRGRLLARDEEITMYFDALSTCNQYLRTIVDIFRDRIMPEADTYELCQLQARLESE
jgi:hypothetical protein